MRRAGAAALLAVVAIVWVAGVGRGQGEYPSPEDLLEEAARAARYVDYVGDEMLLVHRRGGATLSRFQVVHSGGATVIRERGRADLAVLSVERGSVLRVGGAWTEITSGEMRAVDPERLAERKYRFTTTGEATVAERDAFVVEVRARDGGELVQRLYADKESGLLLRRQDYWRGRLWRTEQFERITLVSRSQRLPRPELRQSLELVRAKDLRPPFWAPEELPLGYRLVDILRNPESTEIQCIYSDGLRTVSVFQQRGELDPRPLASPVTIGQQRVFYEPLGTGDAWTWGGRGIVLTLLGDAPPGEVRSLLAAYSRAGGKRSLGDRVRSFFRQVSAFFGG